MKLELIRMWHRGHLEFQALLLQQRGDKGDTTRQAIKTRHEQRCSSCLALSDGFGQLRTIVISGGFDFLVARKLFAAISVRATPNMVAKKMT